MGNTKKISLIALLFLLFYSGTIILSQINNNVSYLYDIELVNDLNGVYSRAVDFSFQDSQGNIWITTREGLFLFDGVHAERINIGFDMKDALFWKSIVEDKEGNIWLHLFDSITGSNKLVVLEERDFLGWVWTDQIGNLPCDCANFKEIIRAPRLGILLLKHDGSIYNIKLNQAMSNLVLLDDYFVDDYDLLVRVQTFDEGCILLYSNGKIKYWDLYNNMRFIVYETLAFSDAWIHQNHDGTFSLLVMRDSSQEVEFERLKLSLEDGVLNRDILKQEDMPLFFELDELNVIFCKIRNHFYIINSYYVYTFPDVSPLPKAIDSKITELARAKSLAHINQIDANTLILSSNSGLYVCKFQKQQFTNYNSQDIKGSSSSSIRRFVPLDSSTLLVDGYKGHYLIDLINDKIIKEHPFTNKLYSDFGKAEKDFLQAFKLNEEKIIIKVRPRLFALYDCYTSTFDSIEIVDLDPSFGAEIWDVHFIDDDLCFIACSAGLLHFSLREMKISYFDDSFYNGFQELTTAISYQIKEVSKGQFLIASTSGLYAFNPVDGVTKRFKRNKEGNSYLDDQIHFMYQIDEDLMYLGTNSEGLIKYSLSEGILETVSSINGKKLGAIHFIHLTEDGKIWMSTNNKLILLEEINGIRRSFYIYEGVKVKEFNRQAYHLTEDSRLFLGGVNGGISFYPEKIDLDIYDEKPVVKINKIDWFDVKDRNYKNITSVNKEEPLILESNQNSLRIKCSMTLFGKGKVDYYYRLASSSEEFKRNTNNNINIDLLNYGDDTLQLFGEFNFKGERTELLSLPLSLSKPFYRKNIFFLFIGAVLIFVIYIFTTIREKNSIIMRKRLEAVVYERTQQNLAQADELMEMNKLKDRFFINISHELKTPLSLIKGPLEKLSNSKNIQKEETILMDMLTENVSSLSSLIKDILDLSKLELGKQEVELTAFNLVDFIDNRLDQFRLRLDSQGLELIKEFKEERIYGAFDKKMVYTILSNLIDNCLNHATGLTNIKVSIEREDKFVKLKVTDNGHGIPPHKLKLLFDRFHSVSNKKGGASLGIGLAISKEFAKLMGGDLSAQSIENIGTTFILSIPIRENNPFEKTYLKQEDTKVSIKEERDYLPIDSNTTDQYILIVEDNKQLALFIDLLLKDKYNTVVKHNGVEAWSYLNTEGINPPHLIISDIMMPEMDGFELLECIRKSEQLKHISFLFLTARDGKKDILKAMRIGVEDYLSKPFLESELLTIVENLLRNVQIRIQTTKVPLVTVDDNVTTKVEEIVVEGDVSLADKEFLEEFDDYISKNLGKMQFTIETLSYDLAISSRQLRRKVQKLTGLTPNQYIRNYKMNVARELLENRKVYSVKELSYKLGFKSSAHFAKLFKNHFGRNPSDFV